jgi:hypothetical protein
MLPDPQAIFARCLGLCAQMPHMAVESKNQTPVIFQTVVSILFQTIVLILLMMREMIVFALMQIAIVARCNAMVARLRIVVLMVGSVDWRLAS